MEGVKVDPIVMVSFPRQCGTNILSELDYLTVKGGCESCIHRTFLEIGGVVGVLGRHHTSRQLGVFGGKGVVLCALPP